MYSQFGGKVVKRKLSKKKSVRRRSKSSKKTLRKKRSTKKGGSSVEHYESYDITGIIKEYIIKYFTFRKTKKTKKTVFIHKHDYVNSEGKIEKTTRSINYQGEESLGEFIDASSCGEKCIKLSYLDKDKKIENIEMDVNNKEEKCKHLRELLEFSVNRESAKNAINSDCSNTTGGAKKRSTKKTVKRRSVSKKTVKRRSVSKKTVKRRSTSKKTRSKRR